MESSFLAMRDRHGVAIWWWDVSAKAGTSHSAPVLRQQDIPESICQKLPDGWYHLHLADGFEARRVKNGMVIASEWRLKPFEPSEWRTFVGTEALAEPDNAKIPALAYVETPIRRIRPYGGRVLIQATSNLELLFMAFLFLAAVLGGWWQGRAAILSASALNADKEATQLERFVTKYALFTEARNDLRELRAAKEVLGRTKTVIDLTDVLNQVAENNLKVNAVSLDRDELELSLQMENNADQLRLLATRIEDLPRFSNVTAQNANGSSIITLVAEVDK